MMAIVEANAFLLDRIHTALTIAAVSQWAAVGWLSALWVGLKVEDT